MYTRRPTLAFLAASAIRSLTAPFPSNWFFCPGATPTQDITALHQQMAEIAEQNQRLAHMLHDQNEVIDTLHQDAEVTEDNVDEGNRQLQQAVSRDSHGFRNLVVGLLLGASACLLFLDWYS